MSSSFCEPFTSSTSSSSFLQSGSSSMSDKTLFSKPIESTFGRSSEVAASQYKFERTLKRTLCGTIRLATNLPRKSLVAIKLSSRKQLSDLNLNNCAENPQEEIRLMTKLRDSPLDGHQFVIKLLDTYTLQKGTDLIDCTVLEFADGGEFFDHIQTLAQQGGRMDLNSVRNAFTMIAKGVKFIHKNGIVHMDLSLENILVTKQHILKICDFGLAREGRIFKLSNAPGKFPYMAPEVFAKQEFDGQKADVWSLGVILWCLLTSLALYDIPTDSDARFQRLRNGKQGIQEILTAFKVPGIPDVVIDLLSGMLNVNPTQRFNIQEVLDHPWLQPPRPESVLKSTRGILMDSDAKQSFAFPTTLTAEPKSPSKQLLDRDQKVISPPIDESWSTYHRLYDQFEEKYGKLILAQQQLDTDGSSGSVHSSEPRVTIPSSEPFSLLPSGSIKLETPAPGSKRISNRIGWKRKNGFRETGRRRSPPRFNLNES